MRASDLVMIGPPLTSAFFSACQLQLTSAFLPGSRGAFFALVDVLSPAAEDGSVESGADDDDGEFDPWPAAAAAAAASFFFLFARFLSWRRDSIAPVACAAG